MTDKVLDLQDLAARARAHRAAGRRIALCHGTFDLLHVGHVRHLARAAREADRLFVTLTADAFVNKGPGRPVFHEELRAAHLAALECVDAVAVVHAPTALEAIEALRPDVFVKGGEFRDEAGDVSGHITREREAVERYGGRLFLTDEVTFSSTRLLNGHFDVLTPEQKDYLGALARRTDHREVIARIQGLAGLRVLVVGDAIIDEYHYTAPLGQTGKYNVMAVHYQGEERFAGGSIAVANHLAGFAGEVTLLTALGERDGHEGFIREHLKPRVTPRFLHFRDRPTLVKRRYVDSDMTKLFEVYFGGCGGEDPAVDAEAADWIERHAGDYDLVVVPDFGNGFIGPRMVQALSDHARFLAVNTQLNSGNRGYHVATRYPRADFLSLNEPELRMAAHERNGSLEAVGRRIAERMDVTALAITRGVQGLMLIDRRDGRVHQVPALSTRVVDRIGAGDAFLAIAALTLAGTGDAALAAFAGSVAAALDVQIVCNRDSVEPAALYKYVTTLLK